MHSDNVFFEFIQYVKKMKWLNVIFGLIVIPIIIWRIIDSNADNYLAEYLGIIITIYIVDFLNAKRNYEEKDFCRFTSQLSVENLHAEVFLFFEQILCKDAEKLEKEEIIKFIEKKGFWEEDIKVSRVAGTGAKSNRKTLLKHLKEYTYKKVCEIEYTLKLDGLMNNELVGLFHSLKIMTDETVMEKINSFDNQSSEEKAMDLWELIQECKRLKDIDFSRKAS